MYMVTGFQEAESVLPFTEVRHSALFYLLRQSQSSTQFKKGHRLLFDGKCVKEFADKTISFPIDQTGDDSLDWSEGNGRGRRD